MLFAVTVLLLPSRFQSTSSCPVETIAAPVGLKRNGAERNRTAVRDTGVDHLVQNDWTFTFWQALVFEVRLYS